MKMLMWCGTLILILLGTLNAAELKQATVDAWEQYVQGADAKMQERLRPSQTFLWTDELPDRAQRVRNGEVVVAPLNAHNPQRVLSGLIHHWIGAAFIPNAKLGDILSIVRDYSRYNQYYRPTVITSARISQNDSEDRFSVVMMNNALLKGALASECRSSYVQVDAQHWYGVSRSVRLQQVENYGKADERRLPPDEGSGYIWRFHSISRFTERDGGVYMEVEAIALSRDIPGSVRWIVDPIVRRVAKSSVATTLRQTAEAVNGANAPVIVTSVPTIHGIRSFNQR